MLCSQVRLRLKMKMVRTVRFSKICLSKLKERPSNLDRISKLNNSLIHNKSKCRYRLWLHKPMRWHKISQYRRNQIAREDRIRIRELMSPSVTRRKVVSENSKISLRLLLRMRNSRQRSRQILLAETLLETTMFNTTKWTKTTKVGRGLRIPSMLMWNTQAVANSSNCWLRHRN